METHELEIEVRPDGTVRLHVRGAKGPACEEYAELFRQILAGESAVERTQEYYEAPSGVRVDLRIRE